MRTIVFGLVLLSAPSLYASPWVPQQAHGYAKVATRVLLASRYTNGAMDTTPIGAHREVRVVGYGEVGLGLGFALTLHSDFARVFLLSNPGESTRSFGAPGDPELGLRRRLFSIGGWVGAVETGFRIPLASNSKKAEVLSEEGAQVAELRLGSGVFELRASASLGYAGRNWYVSASGSYTFRTHRFDDMIGWQLESGLDLGFLAGRLRLVGRHLINTASAPAIETVSGVGNGTSSTGAIIELERGLGEVLLVGASFQLSIAGLDVRRQGRGPVFSLYFAARF